MLVLIPVSRLGEHNVINTILMTFLTWIGPCDLLTTVRVCFQDISLENGQSRLWKFIYITVSDYRGYSVTSHLQVVENTGVPSENHRLTPSHG